MSRTCSSTSCTSAEQFGQYHWNFSRVPSSRIRSMTRPIEPASGRCGECGVLRGQQPDLALADVHRVRAVVGHEVDVHVPADLVEPLLVRVDVEVGALIGAAHDHAR